MRAVSVGVEHLGLSTQSFGQLAWNDHVVLRFAAKCLGMRLMRGHIAQECDHPRDGGPDFASETAFHTKNCCF